MTTFCEALAALTEGKAIRRSGWNPCITRDPVYRNMGITHHLDAKGDLVKFRTEWLISDMIADDWEVFDETAPR